MDSSVVFRSLRMTLFIFPLNPLKNKVLGYYTNVGFCKYLFWKKCIFLRIFPNPLENKAQKATAHAGGESPKSVVTQKNVCVIVKDNKNQRVGV